MEKTVTYDKAQLYQNIQSTIKFNNKYEVTPTNRGTSGVTPTKVVSVNPKSKPQNFGSGFRHSSPPKCSPLDLSTVYT